MITDDNGNTVEFEDRVMILNGRFYDKSSILPRKPFRGGGSSRDVISFFESDKFHDWRDKADCLSFESHNDALWAYSEILRNLENHNPMAIFYRKDLTR
jgi:hypothetical protein